MCQELFSFQSAPSPSERAGEGLSVHRKDRTLGQSHKTYEPQSGDLDCGYSPHPFTLLPAGLRESRGYLKQRHLALDSSRLGLSSALRVRLQGRLFCGGGVGGCPLLPSVLWS